MTYKRIATFLVLLAGLAGACFSQTALVQTTLSAAQTGPAYYSGGSQTYTGTVTLAACTGILAPALPGTPVSYILVGKEVEGVLTWNSTTCSGQVFRGYNGTGAAPHVSGDMVLIAVTYQTNLATGGNPQPNGFYEGDPSLNSACTAANTSTTPWVNTRTAAQWLCSSVTGTWVPGFNNPGVGFAPQPTTAVASVAGATLPSGPFFHVTGTNAITSWTIPVGCNATAVGGCEFTVIPDAVCTWTAAGNIALAGSCVVNKPLTFTWDAKNSKWVPNYIA